MKEKEFYFKFIVVMRDQLETKNKVGMNGFCVYRKRRLPILNAGRFAFYFSDLFVPGGIQRKTSDRQSKLSLKQA